MKHKINWAMLGLISMLLVITGIALLQSLAAVSPDPAKLATQCSSCHGMDEHVASWSESAHKDVACTACHADPGVMGWVEMQVGQLRMVTTSRRDPNFDIASVATAVPNSRCTDCHAGQMPWVMQDLEAPQLDQNGEPVRVEKERLAYFPVKAGHDLHLTMENPLACVDCHATVSHGPKERPDQVEVWHQTCLDCHAGERVAVSVPTTISCSACHTDLGLIAPEDHSGADFRATHGKDAEANIQSCQQCHLTPGLVQLAPGDQPPPVLFHPVGETQSHAVIPQMPAGSIRVTEGMKDTCSTCHGITMPHPNEWLTGHTQGFQENPELCASCHGTQDQGFNMKLVGDPKSLSTTDATCTGCHAQPMPHPESYGSSGHTQHALTAPQTCTQCHSSGNRVSPNAPHSSPQFCSDCHQTSFTHPSDYMVTHGAEALAPNGRDVSAACTTCHTTSNFCTTCHTGGVGSGVITQWHPDGWIADHSAAGLSANGSVSVSCTGCHTETVNACADCHTAGFGQGVTQEWHAPNFWITHARTTQPEDFATCNSCHTYVEPSCAKCHRDY